MPISNPLKIAVIVVNYNAGDYLIRCIESLREQSYPIWRIILVDNFSTVNPIMGDEGWLAGINLIRLESNIGFAAANNLAVQSAHGAEWIALLNPDAFPETHWLENLARATELFPDYSSFACRMLCAENPDLLDGAGDNYYISGRVRRRGHMKPAKGLYLNYEEVFSPCGGAALLRKAVFEEIGGFDEDFFCYLEDIDLGFRLRLAGHPCLYVPDAVVHHIGSAVTGRHSNFSIYYGHRNLLWVYIKNMPRILFLVYLPLHILTHLAGLVWYSLRGQGSIIWRAKIDSLKGMAKMFKKRARIQSARKTGSQVWIKLSI